MNKQTMIYILIIIGAIGLLVSLTADITGLGADPFNFGWKQILGTAVSAVIIIAGVVLLLIKNDSGQSESSPQKTKGNKDELL